MTNLERDFLEKYYKACNTCFIADWADAAQAAKDMYHFSSKESDDAEERNIERAAEKFLQM